MKINVPAEYADMAKQHIQGGVDWLQSQEFKDACAMTIPEHDSGERPNITALEVLQAKQAQSRVCTFCLGYGIAGVACVGCGRTVMDNSGQPDLSFNKPRRFPPLSKAMKAIEQRLRSNQEQGTPFKAWHERTKRESIVDILGRDHSSRSWDQDWNSMEEQRARQMTEKTTWYPTAADVAAGWPERGYAAELAKVKAEMMVKEQDKELRAVAEGKHYNLAEAQALMERAAKLAAEATEVPKESVPKSNRFSDPRWSWKKSQHGGYEVSAKEGEKVVDWFKVSTKERAMMLTLFLMGEDPTAQEIRREAKP